MRTFNFRARNIGEEKYLSYTMGEDCELDEDVLDYCQDNAPEELIEIIYEEDDDYDYLTYQITGKTSLEEYIAQEHDCESVLLILRNVAQEMISLKEQAIPLSYVLLNRGFIYVDAEKKTVQFLCLPIESKGALSVEFKSFVRQLLANMKYDVEEDLNYVGKLLTYINGDNFNLRGLIGLAEALMEEEGISFEEAGAIDADGVEVVSAEEEAPAENIGDIMNGLQKKWLTPMPISRCSRPPPRTCWQSRRSDEIKTNLEETVKLLRLCRSLPLRLLTGRLLPCILFIYLLLICTNWI